MFKKIAENLSLSMPYLPGHVYFYDTEGIIHACNLSQAKARGFKSIEECIGVSMYEGRPEPETILLRKNNKIIIDSKQILTFVEMGPDEFGKTCHFLSNKVPVINNDIVVGILGVSVKIDKELAYYQKNEKIFETIIDNLPAHIYWKNRNGVFQGCNLSQAKAAGFSNKEELIGKKDIDMPWSAESQELQNSDKIVMDSGALYTTEEHSTLADGQERIFLSKKMPMYDSDGNIDGIMGISVDITNEKASEKMRVEKESAEREAQYLREFQDLIDLLPANIYWKNKIGVYLRCNLAQAQSVGFDSKEVVFGKRQDQLLPLKADIDCILENDRHVMRTQQPLTVEESVLLPDGSERIYLSKKIPTYDSDGEVDGIFGISVDITAEKEAERLIQESLHKQLHSANLISASIAHELRTPLMTINNNITALKINLPASDQFVLDKVQAVKKEINKANECINMLLMNIREIHLDKVEACSIQACIAEAIERFPYSNSDDIQLIVFNQDEQDFSFMGDRTLMVHVLFNLIKNAVYFIHRAEKGRIYISTAHDQHYNYLYFEDTACGIREANLNKIFDRFYTTTDIGSGVGLSFCKLAIEKFGGSIDCSSVEGEFTKFTIRLPNL